jgi:hypothetical protein
VLIACRVVAKDELDNMLANPQLGRRVPLLFLANKMDLPSALTPVELAQVRVKQCMPCQVLRYQQHQTRPDMQPGAQFSKLAKRLMPSSHPVLSLDLFEHLLFVTCAVCGAQAFRLEEIRERPWQIVPSNALTGEGMDRGMDWLAEKLLRK